MSAAGLGGLGERTDLQTTAIIVHILYRGDRYHGNAMMLVVVCEKGKPVRNFNGCLASQEVFIELIHLGEVIRPEHDMRQLGRRYDLASDIIEVDDHLFGSICFSGAGSGFGFWRIKYTRGCVRESVEWLNERSV
jgi:hypothetical protein